MKRFLLILFMLLMPLQSSWAAVMAYGQHAGVGESTEHCCQAVKALDQVKPGLTQQVQQQNFVKMVEDMKAKAKIEITAAPVVTTPIVPPTAPASALVEAGTTPASTAPDKK